MLQTLLCSKIFISVMSDSEFNKILSLMPSDHCGKDLRYENIYDKIKDNRFEEEDYLSMGIWERDLKKANWQEVKDLCLKAMNETSDLQIVCWFCESVCHINGWDGLNLSFSLLKAFCETKWNISYPLIDNENLEFGLEHRIRVFEWFFNIVNEAMLFMPITLPNGINDQSLNLGLWKSAINIDSIARRSGNSESKLQELENSDNITLKKFRKIIKQSSNEYLISLKGIVELIKNNVLNLEILLKEKFDNQQPSLKKIINSLDDVEKICNFGLEDLEKNQKNKNTEIIEESQIDIFDEQKDYIKEQENALKNNYNEVHVEQSVSIEDAEDENEVTIKNKNDAYNALKDLADFLIEIDPQSPGPYLVQMVAQWNSKTLPDIMDDISQGQTQGHKVLKMISEISRKS